VDCVTGALRFAPYGETMDLANVVVDGSPNAATTLLLSHWPGMAPPPPGTEADLSAQMALRYVAAGGLTTAGGRHGDATVVTNNHFDQDGAVGVLALVEPDLGRRHRALLEDVAGAGDFAVARTRDGARLSAALAALADVERTPIRGVAPGSDGWAAALYEAALSLLPGWLAEVGSARALWVDDDAALTASEAAIASGAVRIDERPDVDLAVVTLPAGTGWGGHRFAHLRHEGLHPIALHGATERFVVLLLAADGRHRLVQRYETWVQYRTRRPRSRRDLAPLAERLTALEPGATRWAVDPVGALTPTLAPAGGASSSVAPEVLVEAVVAHLAAAPPAWDPFRPRP
jgi:hypothetical protein